MACIDKKFNECLDIKANEDNVPKQPEFEALYTAGPLDSLISKEDAEKKVLALKYILEKDLRAADLKWSLFVAACHTYRTDSCLRPFPPMYIKNDTKDIDSLRRVVELVPPLPLIAQELREPNIYQNKAATIELLFWVLLKLGDLHIKSISKDCHESVLKRVNSEVAVAAPNLIFQVASAKQSATEERWREQAKGRSTFFAFHGSRLENFHSILHYGLQQNMCKKALFGEGIYLSNELTVSLPYSPVGYGWGGSILGSDMSCVALCEIINHPEVKIGTEDNSSRNITIETTGSKVPNKYCLVTNSDLVRIRYLLIYSQEFGRLRSTRNSGVLGWLRQHKLLTFMLGYVMLLASVGLSHNRNVERYIRLMMRRFGLD